MAQANEPTAAARTARRDKPWIFRTYAGHSTARESNRLYRQNLAKGQTGLSIAFDLPTQTGFDSDHPLARGEVGKVGVAISHIGDMRALFDGDPARLDEYVDDHQRDRAMADGALRRDRRRAGRAARSAPGHDPERHHQGISGARRLCVPARRLSPADQGPDPLLRPRDAEVEPDERVLLPFAGSGRDAGAGIELRARDRDRGARAGARSRARSTKQASPMSSAACRSSSTPGCASSPNSPRCGPSSSSGTRSPATASASPTR